jgi:hypothetical protein
VGDVVGHDLIGVDATAFSHFRAGLVDQLLGDLDRFRRAREVEIARMGCCHGARPYRLV